MAREKGRYIRCQNCATYHRITESSTPRCPACGEVRRPISANPWSDDRPAEKDGPAPPRDARKVYARALMANETTPQDFAERLLWTITEAAVALNHPSSKRWPPPPVVRPAHLTRNAIDDELLPIVMSDLELYLPLLPTRPSDVRN
jgi:hypothetical protein